MTAHIYEFGHFRIDEQERQLACSGRVIPLRGRVFDTLCALVRNAGRLMRKNELMKTIWPDAVVEENNLQHNLSVLRKIFRQHSSGRRFIETVPRQGYRFVAKVRVIDDAAVFAGTAPLPVDFYIERSETELLRHPVPGRRLQSISAPGLTKRLSLSQSPTAMTQEHPLRKQADLLQAIAKERMLVLVLEDLRWRDCSTLVVRLRIAPRHEYGRAKTAGLLLRALQSASAELSDTPSRQGSREAMEQQRPLRALKRDENIVVLRPVGIKSVVLQDSEDEFFAPEEQSKHPQPAAILHTKPCRDR